MYNFIKVIFKNLILVTIRVYKYMISPMLGSNCRFLPSCSDYAQEAILEKGIIKGSQLILKRLAKCQPWGKSGYDPLIK